MDRTSLDLNLCAPSPSLGLGALSLCTPSPNLGLVVLGLMTLGLGALCPGTLGHPITGITGGMKELKQSLVSVLTARYLKCGASSGTPLKKS